MVEIIYPPNAIALLAVSNARTISELAGLITEAVMAAQPQPIIRWSVPSSAPMKKMQPNNLPRELLDAQPGQGNQTAAFQLADGSIGSLFHPFEKLEWNFTLDLIVPPNSPKETTAILRSQRSLARLILENPLFTEVTVSMQGPGANCIPDVPIVGIRTYLVSCNPSKVEEQYTNPEDFWHSGWQAVDWIGEHAILERAMDTIGSLSYLRQVIPQQWKLARAAKPGRCQYGIPQVYPEEKSVFYAGEPALNLVGYYDTDAVVELSCALQPPHHVQGYEIFNLYALLQTRITQDGRPIQGVRVVFLYQEMAFSERRPLLDIGAQVLYYDSDGYLKNLNE